MALTSIILAAGKSTRMKSSRPKPLHEICGKPMLQYIIDACFGAGCDRIIVVVGYAKEEVIAAFGRDDRITFVEQTEQLGTGHAAKVCEAELRKSGGDTFILAGDVPLTRSEVLRTLYDTHKSEKAAASMATAVLDDPTGYGRIIRDKNGDFVDIVEQLDCTPQQREIREVFPSYYCVKVDELLLALSKLTNDNKKREYYLTDIFGILRRAGKKIVAVQAVSADDVIAPNTRQQLAEADAVMQERIQRMLRDSGVTIVSSTSTYIEAGVTIGPDSILEPLSFIGRDTSIGGQCTIGPFAVVPRESIVPEGTTIAGNVSPQTATLLQSQTGN
ncbi:MAG TPA: NTP transferase domain-containing protein [Tepidisphaeraceae bacterium]|jgi:bifunctional UDP-N-acetylglucosamine pyrophosphorylase/glucosamine-1-phosphate N-acetyltransferase